MTVAPGLKLGGLEPITRNAGYPLADWPASLGAPSRRGRPLLSAYSCVARSPRDLVSGLLAVWGQGRVRLPVAPGSETDFPVGVAKASQTPHGRIPNTTNPHSNRKATSDPRSFSSSRSSRRFRFVRQPCPLRRVAGSVIPVLSGVARPLRRFFLTGTSRAASFFILRLRRQRVPLLTPRGGSHLSFAGASRSLFTGAEILGCGSVAALRHGAVALVCHWVARVSEPGDASTRPQKARPEHVRARSSSALRIQFAFTISFHILFPSFTIGLAAWLVVLEALWLKTGQPIYRDIAQHWTKIFAVSFGMGVVSGVVLSYEFGTNWSELPAAAATSLGRSCLTRC